MTLDDALSLVIARTGHERYRTLCADDHPDHEAYRETVLRLAAEFDGQPPPLSARAVNLAGAVVRVASAVVHGEPLTLPQEAVAARLAVCSACPERVAPGLCAVCGCLLTAKARLATERCPLGKWPEDSEKISLDAPRDAD